MSREIKFKGRYYIKDENKYKWMKYIFKQEQDLTDVNPYAPDETTIAKASDNLDDVIQLFNDFLLACTWNQMQVNRALQQFLDNDPYK